MTLGYVGIVLQLSFCLINSILFFIKYGEKLSRLRGRTSEQLERARLRVLLQEELDKECKEKIRNDKEGEREIQKRKRILINNQFKNQHVELIELNQQIIDIQ